jgi:hypothetical protein
VEGAGLPHVALLSHVVVCARYGCVRYVISMCTRRSSLLERETDSYS